MIPWQTIPYALVTIFALFANDCETEKWMKLWYTVGFVVLATWLFVDVSIG